MLVICVNKNSPTSSFARKIGGEIGIVNKLTAVALYPNAKHLALERVSPMWCIVFPGHRKRKEHLICKIVIHLCFIPFSTFLGSLLNETR